MNTSGFLLTVDGGGTKTEAYCLSLDGNYYRKYLVKGSNYSVYGDDGLKEIKNLLLQAAEDAGISPRDYTGIALGLAGYAAEEPKQKLINLLNELGCEPQSYLVADAHLGLYTIFKDKPGIIVISGTGSICMGKDAEGNIYRSGGFGWLVGDEGSGFWLGQNAMKRVLMLPVNQQSGGSPLVRHILETLKTKTLEDAARTITLSSSPHATIASLSRAVQLAVEEGDDLALNIVREGGNLLANTVLQLCERMQIKDKNLEIGYKGSVIENLPELRDAIRLTLEYHFDNVVWKKSDMRPAAGGIYLLLEKLCLPSSDSLENILLKMV